ncbi:hypothetical protein GCM10010260_09290 [Streptomyces filipinensis]|uniref:Uncharacterized protein n=1 Tax=Streptomyces filipinensis TaxID=66887 RepID=A0A918I875_9ACTN|nr:hypothetical protein GCM10010260_09290 [Streptomyces filipinensis]
MLRLTGEGGEELLARPRGPKQAEITDQVRFDTLPAFLRHLDDPAEQAAVLRRRLDSLETPASFFYREGEAVRAEEAGDLFREGVPRVARATAKAERVRLREAVETLSRAAS